MINLKHDSNWLTIGIAVLIGVISFYQVVGLRALDFSNVLWLTTNTDTFTQYIGWEFFRNDEWRWPLGSNPHYGIELSSSIIFSDSIPLISIPLKLFSPKLPDVFQFSGCWLLVCFMLQAYYTIKLVKLTTPSLMIAGAAAVLFTFSPAFLWRLHAHSLFAHWLVLLALYIYLRNGDDDLKRSLKWIALLTASVLVHTYFLGMLSVIWIADIAQRNSEFGRDFKSRWAEISLTMVAIGTALWAAGFFPLTTSYLSGGYGSHRFNLTSLFNPQGGTSSDADIWSHLFPALPQGPGDYEGFNFLGLGGILALLCALPAFWRSRRNILNDKMAPLLAACAVLFLFALSNKIGIGARTFEIWIPEILVQAGNIMRASGRFFWPIYYLILLYALNLIIKNYEKKIVFWLIFTFAAAQVYDTRPGWLAFQDNFNLAGTEWKNTLNRDDIIQMAKRYEKIRALPVENARKDWDKISYLALKSGLPTDVAYLARANGVVIKRAANAAKSSIEDGLLDRSALYFLTEEYAVRVQAVMGKEDRLFKEGDQYIYAANWNASQNQKLDLAPSPIKR
jgi:hypothetical protein